MIPLPQVQYVRRVLDSEITEVKINIFINIAETCNDLKEWLSSCIKKFLKLKTLGWAGPILHNTVMRLTDHSRMGDALWFEVGEDLGRFSINECYLLTGMKCVGSTQLAPAVDNRLMRRYFSTLQAMSREHLELQLSNAKFDNDDDVVKFGFLYMIFCIPLVNANSVKIDPKYFSLADNLEEFNAFPWGMHSWEATRAAICNAVENKLSSKRRPLKKGDKVHHSIAGISHALLVWAYESIPTIASKFTTKYVEAIPQLLSWTSTDNVKFDVVMSTLTVVG